MRHATTSWASRFVRHYQTFMEAVCVDIDNRQRGKQLSFEAYLSIRCNTVGILPFLDLIHLFRGSFTSSNFESSGEMLRLEELAVKLIVFQNVSCLFS